LAKIGVENKAGGFRVGRERQWGGGKGTRVFEHGGFLWSETKSGKCGGPTVWELLTRRKAQR